MAVATDDMLLTSASITHVNKLKLDLSHYLEISDMGETCWYLGFEIKRDRRAHTISINQRSYLESITNKFQLTNAKPVMTPMEPGMLLSKEQAPQSICHKICMRNIPYAEAIGSILWPTII